MDSRMIGTWLATAGIIFAQENSDAAGTTGELKPPRVEIPDPNGDLARLATMMLGKNGGNQLFYLPSRDEPSNPGKWGYKFEEISFPSADGTSLHGWFIPPKNAKPKGTIVFSHGNAGAIGHHLGFVLWLVEANYNVMMYDYRGFGKSEGRVDRRGMLDDVKAAFAYVAGRSDVDSERLVSFGHSLGGAKSITALAEGPVSGLRAIVIDGAFSSYQSMAKVMVGQLGANLVTDEWAPKDFVDKLAPVPLLVIHGCEDEIVPFAQGKELFECAKEPKTLFEVKEGRHNDALSRDQGAYRRKMIEWLDETMEG
jgi:fermentation-respiration switch protein FrsA (DUF1100 family)